MPVELIFGGASFKDPTTYLIDSIEEALTLLSINNVKSIDTAAAYKQSEQLLGEVKAPQNFTIDTKYSGGMMAEPTTPTAITNSLDASL
ncbi:hypothetical protein FE257_013058 [Aspergillus nanangensis]|uniref:NADP-dependent oxidoreductase domain-containing protein n=1 Tax=Aspergillus nanangensis TaxID=2582783 RepID=A0AAD4CEX7_ASPNN|nr:hypothetical protein FE257_013058 [Aspergillus nanangensis]